MHEKDGRCNSSGGRAEEWKVEERKREEGKREPGRAEKGNGKSGEGGQWAGILSGNGGGIAPPVVEQQAGTAGGKASEGLGATGSEIGSTSAENRNTGSSSGTESSESRVLDFA